MSLRAITKDAQEQLSASNGLSDPSFTYDTIRTIQEVAGRLADDVQRQLEPNIEDILEA